MATLEQAIMLATQAHQGQVDKAGAPYILHPLRLMLRMRSETAMIVAVLHDVIEDTPYTLDDLRAAGYAHEVVAALDCLTRRDGESYAEFIARLQPNDLARAVKLADLEDNMDLSRIADPQPRDLERLHKYRHAWEQLRAADALPYD